MTESSPVRTLVPRSGGLQSVMILLLVLGVWTTPAQTQPRPFVVEPPTASAADPSLPQLMLERLRTPLRVQGMTLLGLGAAGGLAAENLEQPEREVAFLEYAPLEPVSDIGNVYGAGETVLGGAVLLWAMGSWRDSDRLTAAGKDLTSTFLVTGAYTWALKMSFRTRRPSGANYSFPSGHTAVAFASATVMRRHFGNGVGILSYTLATFTAAARMEDNRHYLTDVVFGAALGMAVAGAELPSGLPGSLLRHLELRGKGVALSLGF